MHAGTHARCCSRVGVRNHVVTTWKCLFPTLFRKSSDHYSDSTFSEASLCQVSDCLKRRACEVALWISHRQQQLLEAHGRGTTIKQIHGAADCVDLGP